MKKVSRSSQRTESKAKPVITVGLDLGDRRSHYCMLNEDGEVVEEGRIATNEAGIRQQFEGEPRQRVAMESGTHSPWISRLLEQLGHQVIVANARKLRVISQNESKNDRADAELLARLAASDPRLLSPIHHRSPQRQQDLNLIRTRDALVRARTMLINAARGLAKSAGSRLPTCTPACLPQRASVVLTAGLKPAIQPLLEQIAALSRQILQLDGDIDKLAHRYPEIGLLRTAPGVGPIVAAAYVLTLDHAETVSSSRAVGAFLGLRPRQSQSGDSNPEHRISKTGNLYLRRLLVQSAHYVLGRFGRDSALRRWGLGLAASGGKRGKKRALVAVARKLAVILNCMWRAGRPYEPFPQTTLTALAMA
jgi:transposase